MEEVNKKRCDNIDKNGKKCKKQPHLEFQEEKRLNVVNIERKKCLI